MVKIKNNIVTKGWSGKLGNDIVFRKRGSQTLVALAAAKSNKEPSEKQKAQKQRFRLATIYPKAQLADADGKAYYEALAEDNKSAYIQAVTDYLKSPIVSDVDIGAYTGAVNDPIAIEATDVFAVTSVEVKILDAADAEVESGLATLDPTGRWIYSATTINANPNAGKIMVTAKDRPGNATVLEVPLS